MAEQRNGVPHKQIIALVLLPLEDTIEQSIPLPCGAPAPVGIAPRLFAGQVSSEPACKCRLSAGLRVHSNKVN